MKENGKFLGKFLILLALILLGIGFGTILLGKDFQDFFVWWFMILGLGIISMPLTMIFFHRFQDSGWIFSKAIGIAFSGWFMWYLSSIKWMKFSESNTRVTVFLFFLCNLAVLFLQIKKLREKQKQPLPDLQEEKRGIRERLLSIMTEELLFYILLLLWVYIRTFRPEAYGTEKFMNYGFMSSMMRTEYFPPKDFWLSGTNLNYYYFGQYLSTYLTKLSGLTVPKTYNLMMMLLPSLSFVMSASIAFELSKLYFKRKTVSLRKKRVLSTVSAGLSGIAVTFASNLHYPIFAWVMPKIKGFLGLELNDYWFANSTRYIGYNPETADKTIHEFPAYSFVLGDLHAHVINLMFVFTVLALLIAYLQHRSFWMDKTLEKQTVKSWSWKKEVFSKEVWLLGFFIGLFHMTNYWDFPIYYVVAGAILLFSNGIFQSFRIKALFTTAIQGVLVLVIANLVCLPFTLSFDQISSVFNIAMSATPVYQFIILWGLPVVVVAYFCISRYLRLQWNGKIEIPLKAQLSTDLEEVPEKKKNRLFQFLEQLKAEDLFLVTVGLCALGLIVLPELFYVKDIYGGDYKRANTMFKLTYQAFALFGIVMGVLLPRMLIMSRKFFEKFVAGFTLVLLLCTSTYIVEAVGAWYGNIFDYKRDRTLDGSVFVNKESKEDARAIAWLNNNIEGQPVVLEVNGDSYTYYQRVSVLTGLPTVLGWRTHEWLWHGSDSADYPSDQQERVDHIKTIYTSKNKDLVVYLLSKYNVEYIYVGKCELEKYKEPINHTLLKELGKVVFETGNTYIVELER